MIALGRKTLFYEWRRFVPAILGVGFSGILLVIQAALVLGIFGSAAVSVTASTADLWIGYPNTQSVNFGQAIGADVEMLLRADPDIVAVEPYEWVEADWRSASPASGSVSVFLSGLGTGEGSMAFARALTPNLRRALNVPGAVIVDRSDLSQLGAQPGDDAWINGHLVHVAGAIAGIRALGGVNVLASMDTALTVRQADGMPGPTYLLARLRHSANPADVRDRLNGNKSSDQFGPFDAWTADQFARRSQLYWMFDTGAGEAVFFMAAIVLIVGAVITSQSLTAVVVGSAREYAMLNALGVGRSALGRVVLGQSCWIGGIGLCFAALASSAILVVAKRQDVPVAMNLSAAAACVLLLIFLSLASGIIAQRGLLRADPALLLR